MAVVRKTEYAAVQPWPDRQDLLSCAMCEERC